MLTPQEIEIVECFFDEWVENEMSLPGDISYQKVIDFLQKIGIDPSKITARLDELSASTR